MQFVVVVANKRVNSRYVMEDGDKRIPMIVEAHSPDLDSIPLENTPGFDALNMSRHYNVFFAKDEGNAKAMAHALSAVNGDKQVYWAKMIGAFESVPSKPVEKVVNEKGVLPV